MKSIVIKENELKDTIFAKWKKEIIEADALIFQACVSNVLRNTDDNYFFNADTGVLEIDRKEVLTTFFAEKKVSPENEAAYQILADFIMFKLYGAYFFLERGDSGMSNQYILPVL